MTTPPGPIDDLNEALQEAADAIYDLNLGVAASVPMDDTECMLIWRKDGSNWSLLLQPHGAKASGLLLNASKRHRILAAKSLHKLLDALRAEHAKQDTEVHEATAAARAFVKHCRTTER